MLNLICLWFVTSVVVGSPIAIACMFIHGLIAERRDLNRYCVLIEEKSARQVAARNI